MIRKTFLALALLQLALFFGGSQTVRSEQITIFLKDGKQVKTDAIQRNGNSLMVVVQSGQLGYDLPKIDRVDFPETSGFGAVINLLAQNKAVAALEAVQPLINYYQPFADVPGNRLSQAIALKVTALSNLGRTAEADALLQQLARISKDPEVQLLAQARLSRSWIAKGLPQKTEVICDQVIATSKSPETLAYAWLNKGLALAADSEWESAARACVHVTVFFPEQKSTLPLAMLTIARAVSALNDLPEATKRYQALIDAYPDSSEAAAAKAELKKISS